MGPIDWAMYVSGNGTLAVYEQTPVGVKGQSVPTARVTSWAVTYDGSNIRYLKNGVALRTVARYDHPAACMPMLPFATAGTKVTKLPVW